MNKSIRFSKAKHGSLAFTLMEVVIGMALLSMLSVISWTLMSGWMGTSVVGIWRQHTNKSLALVSTSIRTSLGKSSYPSSVTPEDTVVAYSEDYFINLLGEDPGSDVPDLDGEDWSGYKVVKAGPGKDGAADEAEEVFLEIYSGSPGKARIPGFDDSDVGLTKVSYLLKGGDSVRGKERICKGVKSLYIKTSSGSVAADGYVTDTAITLAEDNEKLLATDVNYVLMGVPESCLSGDASPLTSQPAVKIKIFCVDHQKGKAKLSVTIDCSGGTGVKFGS